MAARIQLLDGSVIVLADRGALKNCYGVHVVPETLDALFTDREAWLDVYAEGVKRRIFARAVASVTVDRAPDT
jgi:hypothetical protein